MIESFEIGSVSVVAAARLLAELLRRLEASWPRDRALRILQIGHGPSVMARGGTGKHAWRTADDRRSQSPASRTRPFGVHAEPGICFAEASKSHGGSFDLVVAADALHRVAPDAALLARVVETMAPDALLAAIEPAPSLFRDVVFWSPGGQFVGTEAEEESASSLSDWAARRFAATPLRASRSRPSRPRPAQRFSSPAKCPAFAGRRNLPAKVVIVGGSARDRRKPQARFRPC